MKLKLPSSMRRSRKVGFVKQDAAADETTTKSSSPHDGEQISRKEQKERSKLQKKIDRLLGEPVPSKAYPIQRSQTKEELMFMISRLEQSMQDQSTQLLEQNKMLHEKLQQLIDEDSDEEDTLMPIEQGSYEVDQGGVKWRVAGYSSIEPSPDYNYFPGLSWVTDSNDSIEYRYGKDKVISVIVPCFNERGSDLQRTVRSLYRQRLPEGWRIEVVIVMDGVDNMDKSMADYLATLFGVHFNSEDPETDPFLKLDPAETIIVDAFNKKQAFNRTPAVDKTVGGYSLVVKRRNHRKANSQMWWLGPHSQFIKCQYSLATDCGTVFARTATIHLIRRMEAEPNLHAVTGFQRIMNSYMQGDGIFEPLHDPFSFMLRMLQRFEFEVDHVSFKSVYDSLGCMHVIPGPCGLFRYSAMGTLKEGLMHDYFSLFHGASQGLIVGNVELVEDRIPGTLLSFPTKSAKEKATMPPEGWPRTGFVHEAVFYVEAEKPLSQLMKQRRRWLNGTFATYIWMLMEGVVTQSNQDPINRFLSWILVLINVFQGLVIRLVGPALLIVWIFRFGLFIPDFFDDPAAIFDPELNLVSLEIEEGRWKYGAVTGGLYFLLYAAYIIFHTPKAKPVESKIKIIRYTEPTAYGSDKASAFRGWLCYPVLWASFIMVCLFFVNTCGILATQGWSGTPILVRILICICFAPFIMGVLDGVMRCDFRCLGGMIYSVPFALPLKIWFTIWLPAYATTRLSDLTWGNRDNVDSLDESNRALKRAKDGRRVAKFLIGVNLAISVGIIALMQFFHNTFPIFVMTYTAILSFTYVISLLDMVFRLFTCEQSEDAPIEEDDDDEFDFCGCGDDDYVEMDDSSARKSKKMTDEAKQGGFIVLEDKRDDGLLISEPSIEVDQKGDLA